MENCILIIFDKSIQSKLNIILLSKLLKLNNIFYFIYMTSFILALLSFSLCFDFKSSIVTTINDSNFKEYIPNKRCVILEFYSPSCPHCVNLAPIYEEVFQITAEKRPDVIVAKIDGSANHASISQYTIYGYPTITVFLPGNSTQYHSIFNNSRTKESIFEWINNICPQPIPEPKKEKQPLVKVKTDSMIIIDSVKTEILK